MLFMYTTSGRQDGNRSNGKETPWARPLLDRAATSRTEFWSDEDSRQSSIRPTAFARKELYPLCERMDRDDGGREAAFPKIGDNGFFGVTIPEEYGGSAKTSAAGLVLQGSPLDHAMALFLGGADNLCANNIYRNGNEQQRRKYLPDLCAGRTIGALGLTEPGAGSDALGSMRTPPVEMAITTSSMAARSILPTTCRRRPPRLRQNRSR